MKPNWNDIVDYARGLASDEAQLRVESDPEAMESAKQMKLVFAAGQSQAPQNFADRAKALMPAAAKSSSIFRGLLAFSNKDLAFGFRSGAAAAQDLRYEFPNAQVEMRIEPASNPRRRVAVGVFSSPDPQFVEVRAGAGSKAPCDELGQFEIEFASDELILQFVDNKTGDIYEIELK